MAGEQLPRLLLLQAVHSPDEVLTADGGEVENAERVFSEVFLRLMRFLYKKNTKNSPSFITSDQY
jgi:hypothetical protein